MDESEKQKVVKHSTTIQEKPKNEEIIVKHVLPKKINLLIT
jgi:hypothetical protein